MDQTQLKTALETIGDKMGDTVSALIPVGETLGMWFTVLSFVFLGLSIGFSSSSLISPVVLISGRAVAALWTIGSWEQLTNGALGGARAMIGQMIGGYTGPSTLFGMALKVSGRILVSTVEVSWWLPVDMVFIGLAAFFTAVGLAVTGILAYLAEFNLLLGAAVSPLVLGALAWGVTGSLGFSPVRFLLTAAVRVVVMGATADIMADSILEVTSIAGREQPLTHAEVTTIAFLAIICGVVGFSMNSLAASLVSGAATALGWSSVTHSVSTSGSIAHAGVSAAGAAAGVATGPAGAAAVSAASRGGQAMGRVASSAMSGSAFGGGRKP